MSLFFELFFLVSLLHIYMRVAVSKEVGTIILAANGICCLFPASVVVPRIVGSHLLIVWIIPCDL